MPRASQAATSPAPAAAKATEKRKKPQETGPEVAPKRKRARAEGGQQPPAPTEFAPGTRVEARWLNGKGDVSTKGDAREGGCGYHPGWYGGVVTGAGDASGTFKVAYDDGNTHRFVAPRHMRRPKA